jgi:predicted metal-dependent hydrolase
VNIKSQHIEVSGIKVEVVRKNIKNLHLAVYPPSGRVRIAVPLRIDNDAARLAVVSKLSWIKKRQAKFLGQDRQSRREYISGESHYYFGRRYRLRVTHADGPAHVFIRNKTFIDMQVPRNYTRDQRERLMYRWYRQELRNVLPVLVTKWEKKMRLKANELRIKRLKTMWGSCNPTAKRIWFNLELAKKSELCVEYIIVHELAHLIERNHGDRFIKLMDRFMPQWRSIREELNKSPLAHENWSY